MKPRRWFRYSLRALLFLTLCIAGVLAGYPAGKKLGFRAGYHKGFRAGEDHKKLLDSLTTVVYPVGDLVSPLDAAGKPIAQQADFASLIELITTSIDATSWDESGGPGSIKEVETNLSVVITQSPAAHKKIERLLTDLRRIKLAPTGGARTKRP